MEWYYFTTGQIIDNLKVGEIAEGSTHWEIKKLLDGRIVELNSGNEFKFDKSFLDEKWRIINNYVSFEEAKEAASKGKVIECEYRDKTIQLSYNSRLHNLDHGAFTIAMLDEAKWTILD